MNVRFIVDLLFGMPFAVGKGKREEIGGRSSYLGVLRKIDLINSCSG